MFFRSGILNIILIAIVIILPYYYGYINAVNESKLQLQQTPNNCNDAPIEISPTLRQLIDKRVQQELSHEEDSIKSSYYKDTIFPKSTSSYAVGALRISRDELLQTYDFGVPIKSATDSEAIIIYNTRTSLPSDTKLKNEAIHGIQHQQGDSSILATSSVSKAMQNCDTLNVIFTSINPNAKDCHVITSNFESYHINRWLRVPPFEGLKPKDRILNSTSPLRHVGRITLGKNGVDEFDLPELWKNFKRKEKGFLLQHFDRLQIFLENVDAVLKELKELLEKRKVVRDNTVVVLTVNAGQSELLSNFICSARSRGLSTDNILVFPTDEEAYKLSQGLGIATYFDAKNLGILPSGEAKAYGDPIFASMMYAKVLCVLYVSLLGHDVLFQDVDIVWYKDPLTYFHDKSNVAIQEFDILFQHDGSAQPRYNPYSANSGFYYVRANKKTAYLFTSLLYHGAVIRKSKSHQQVLVQLLNEHSSLFGLKVKVFDKIQTDMFPGGFHYHQDWPTMHKIIEGTSNAYLLHMSWTENKVNKLLFFRQMGEWYVRDECISKDITKLMEGDVSDGSLIEQCCSIEPIFSCHYQDKPSKIPCPDSPKIDLKRDKLFWQ